MFKVGDIVEIIRLEGMDVSHGYKIGDKFMIMSVRKGNDSDTIYCDKETGDSGRGFLSDQLKKVGNINEVKFKVGDVIILQCNPKCSATTAEKGARAIVEKLGNPYLYVKWIRDGKDKGQSSGGYEYENFEKVKFKVGDRVTLICLGVKSEIGVVVKIRSYEESNSHPFLVRWSGEEHKTWPYKESELDFYRETELTKEEQMSDSKERGLFSIRAISKETDEIVYSAEIVACGENEALYESDMKDALKAKKLTRDDVHVIVTEIGKLPAKEDIKKVKVLGQIGDFAAVKVQK